MPRKNFVEQLSKPLALVFPINVNPNAAPFFNIYKPYAQQDCHIKMISRRWRHLVEADKLPLQLLANRSIELPKLQNSLAVTTFFICFGYERLDCDLGLVARQVVLCKRTLLWKIHNGVGLILFVDLLQKQNWAHNTSKFAFFAKPGWGCFCVFL